MFPQKEKLHNAANRNQISTHHIPWLLAEINELGKFCQSLDKMSLWENLLAASILKSIYKILTQTGRKTSYLNF